MRYLVSTFLAATLITAASSAKADQLFTTRSSSTAIVVNCPGVPTNQTCNPNYRLGSGDFLGFPGIEDFNPLHFGAISSSFARLVPVGGTQSHGSGIAFSLTDATSDLPILKSGAFTRPNDLGRDTTSYSFISTLSAFTYSGTAALALPLIGNIDYFQTFAPINFANPVGPNSYPFSFGSLRSRLAILTPEAFQGFALNPNALTCGASGVLASAGANNGIGGFASGGGRQDRTTTLDVSLGCDGAPVVLQPGQRFYVYAFLESLALRGATVDATNSFAVNFLPNTPTDVRQALINGLTPILAVPEPSSWAMMLLGFGLLGSALRVGKSRHPDKGRGAWLRSCFKRNRFLA